MPPKKTPLRRKALSAADLAKELSVSPMTVSRALRGLPSVTEETRNKVLQLARKRGLEPGRAGAKEKRPIVFHMPEHFLLEPDQHPFWSRLYFLFKKNLEELGLACQAADLDSGLGSAHVGQASAVAIFFGLGPRGRETLGRLRKDIPVAGILEGSLPCHIGVDHRGASEELAALIAAGGHEHVAVFGIPGGGVDSRASCLKRSLLASSPKIRFDFIACPYHDHPRSRQDAFLKQTLLAWFQKTDALPTVFYATDAYVALSAWRFFRQDLKCAIPQEMGLAGFDHSPVYQHIEPEITRIGFDVEALARFAADQIFQIAEKGVAVPGNHEIRAQFVPGHSVIPLADMRRPSLKKLRSNL